jgi:formylglycine-generating enzyme required for sulfatase activity
MCNFIPMKKIVYLLFVYFMILNLSVQAGSPDCIFVKGGKMILNDQTVAVESFRIMKYEVTNDQFASFLNEEKIGSDGIYKGILMVNVTSADLQLEYRNRTWTSRPGKENYPMVMVNYFGASEFCKWIGGKLPSETEWTYAAKGGCRSKSFIFAGSNSLDEVGWYKGNSDAHSHEKGLMKPNELGIYDMSGNVWEWCLNDTLKNVTDFCVHKGGSWYADEQPGQISSHYGNTPTHFSNSVGFRAIFQVQRQQVNQ